MTMIGMSIAQLTTQKTQIYVMSCIQHTYLLDALAGRTDDGEHDGQEANSGKKP